MSRSAGLIMALILFVSSYLNVLAIKKVTSIKLGDLQETD